MNAIIGLPEWLALAIVVGSVLAASMLGFLLVHRRWPVEARQKHNDVAGFIFAVVGVMYSVLLGFVVVVQWEQYREAVAATEHEAAVLLAVQHRLDSAPASEDPVARSRALAAVHAYAASVVNVEFPQLEAGHVPPNNNRALDELWSATAPGTSDAATGELSQARDLLDDLEEARALRLLAADDGLPIGMWLAILLGGVLTIGFACLFGTENTVAHAVMIVSLAGLVGVLWYVALELNHSFIGQVQVKPAGFEQIMGRPAR